MRTLLFLACCTIVLSGCSAKYVLDKPAIRNYNLSQEDLAHIQFYNSRDIVLSRYAESSAEKSTEKGTLNVNTGKEVDQVVIKANTRGKIVKFMEDGKMAVSFEPDESKFLVFGITNTTESYHLQALEWKNNRGRISYGSTTYYTNAGADHCYLRFKLKRAYREDRNLRVAKGNKVK